MTWIRSKTTHLIFVKDHLIQAFHVLLNHGESISSDCKWLLILDILFSILDNSTWPHQRQKMVIPSLENQFYWENKGTTSSLKKNKMRHPK